jgi:hypothetical protein
MTSSRDDDALSWAGDNDPTLAQGESPDAPALPDGWSVPGRPETTEARAEREGASSLALVGTGILAGIYLLYTIGWFVAVSRIGNPLAEPVGRAMFSLGGWLAVAAPIVWFAAAYGLTVERPRRRFAWLLVGAVLLAPLPFVFGTGGVS